MKQIVMAVLTGARGSKRLLRFKEILETYDIFYDMNYTPNHRQPNLVVVYNDGSSVTMSMYPSKETIELVFGPHNYIKGGI